MGELFKGVGDLERLHEVKGGVRLRSWMLRLPLVLPGRPRSYWFRGVPNFGDQLSPEVLSWVLAQKPVWVPESYPGKVLSTGSILSALSEGDTVWGSGLIRAEQCVPPRGVKFLAVRGPLTRSLIGAEVPEVYGDPALLLPLFHAAPVDTTHEVGIVPHYVDQEAVGHIVDPAVRVIDVRRPWRDVVDAIRSCQSIVSSSLHGLIVAEAYGIPASWIAITERVIGGSFKFNDYYMSTGRDVSAPTPWRRGLSEAVANVAAPGEFDPAPVLAAARAIPGGNDSR